MTKKIVVILILLLILFEAYQFGIKLNKIPPIRYMQRNTKEIKLEKVLAKGGLEWLYHDPVGKLALNAIIKRKFISSYYGKKMDSPSSVKKIMPYIKALRLKKPADVSKYHSFNEFFCRDIPNREKRINRDSLVIISPSDGKILAFNKLDDRKNFFIKGVDFSLREFIKNDSIYNIFQNGELMIIRLTPADYHRFYFPYQSKVIKSYKIDGDLYSVSPFALRKKVKIFTQNKREATLLYNDKIGNYLMMEVGATFIGSIIQTFHEHFVGKGEEKGYFKFGGSSIALIFEKDKIEIDNDLLENTRSNYETSILMGEEIAKIKK